MTVKEAQDVHDKLCDEYYKVEGGDIHNQSLIWKMQRAKHAVTVAKQEQAAKFGDIYAIIRRNQA